MLVVGLHRNMAGQGSASDKHSVSAPSTLSIDERVLTAP